MNRLVVSVILGVLLFIAGLTLVKLMSRPSPETFTKSKSVQPGKVVLKMAVYAIQPFTDVRVDRIEYVFSRLKNVLPDLKILPKVQLPAMSYFEPRNRYRADSIIKWLRSAAPANYVLVGITSKDISTRKGNIPDFGVMGLGYSPGNACVASSFRLSKVNTNEELFKVVIHELGHTQGLDHCPEETCFMRDAKGKNHTGEENGFCSNCSKVLVSKGWKL